jgi:tetratricopeptide (TPR) repeat protein
MQLCSRVALAALVGLSVAGAGLSQDTINLKDGSSKQGTIQEADYRGLKVSVTGGGGTTTIKTDDITGITLGNPPKEFKAGEDDLLRGRQDDAIPNLQAVIENKKNRSIFRQDAYIKLAEAYVRSDKADEAIKTLKALIEEFPQTRHLEQAQGMVIMILARTGKAQDAASFAEAEEGRVSKLEQSSGLVERLKLSKARAYLAAGDPKKAKADASTLASGTTPAAGAAKVLLAEISLAEKNVDEAKKLFTDALKVVSARSDRASAFNGLGAILLEQGKNDKKPDLIREANLLFLRTALVLAPEPGESTEAHETGLFNAGVSFQYLAELGAPAPAAGSKAETKTEGKTDDAQARNMQRARENFRRLLSTYPQTKYATEAQQRLQKLGG